MQTPALAGLPAAYIMQQLADFKSGARTSAVMPYGPTRTMVFILQKAEEAELKIAADYFASVTPRQWIRVVEAKNVPQSKIVGTMRVPADGGGTEPIDGRIIELPENLLQTELRDSESGYVAYVPPGSIKAGERLATTGGAAKFQACITCHGPALKGFGQAPPIAGRSPTYVVRQLYDMQQGARTGELAARMKPIVDKLSVADMVAIAAYTASRAP
jgi:cytochrome c553